MATMFDLFIRLCHLRHQVLASGKDIVVNIICGLYWSVHVVSGCDMHFFVNIYIDNFFSPERKQITCLYDCPSVYLSFSACLPVRRSACHCFVSPRSPCLFGSSWNTHQPLSLWIACGLYAVSCKRLNVNITLIVPSFLWFDGFAS